ncbi:DUF1793-domain-containing protein [Fistulina hepatica ATCC 64428]|nr:DUF1793-domain-containing protein [Fistulina hepatica ATCC 64428]
MSCTTCLYILQIVLVIAHAAFAFDWTAIPFNPSSIPLAVRSPYLSAWLPQGEGTALNGIWPEFWNGAILGWAGFVRVDNTTYTFLGTPIVSADYKDAVQQSVQITTTRSIFSLTAGSVDLNVTFLSPVESLPFSYMALSARTNDGESHSVQIYTDISAEWASGDRSLTVNWTTTTSNDVMSHKVGLQDPNVYGEASDQASYGAAYYSTNLTDKLTYQTGRDTSVRGQFIENGVLKDSFNSTYRAVDDEWPVFAFASDLGSVNSEYSDPVVFSIGYVRDPALQYIVADDQMEERSLYCWSQFSSADDAVSFFLNDYSDALQRAQALDEQAQSDASQYGDNYAGIVVMSIRQALGAMEITRKSGNSFDTDDVLLFMKEISSDGDVNTVDVIFPAWPVLLYLNATLGKYILEPTLRYQATGQFPDAYAVHDLGTYPNATGHNDGNDEAMPLEECGNMLIMTLSYTQSSGDTYLIDTYYDLLDQWAQVLVNDSLIPALQLSTDDFAGQLANQTNLAIKGISGIQAMSRIARLAGKDSQASNYSSIAADYVRQWQSLAMSDDGDHLTLNYGNSSSWGLAYNLYADKLLNLDLFPQSIYSMQTSWYGGVFNEYGAPLDTRHTYTKSDWEMWTAAIVTTKTVRDMFIDAVYAYATDGDSTQPFGDWYNTTTGAVNSFRARPVVGGHLALLAL